MNRTLAVAILLACAACSDSSPESESDPDDRVTVLAAGDIDGCEVDGDEATADLLDGLQGTILALGDLAYPDGTAEQFRDCYGPSWGRHRARTKRVPGNHESRAGSTFGVLELKLREGSYDWRFVPVEGESFTDEGSGRCR